MAVSTPQLVEKIVKRSPFLIDAMADDLINLSALARTMQPEIEKTLDKKASEASIMMALKRLTAHLQKRKLDFYDLRNTRVRLSVRSGLMQLVYKNSASLLDVQKKLTELMDENNDTYIHFVHGESETTFVVDAEIADKVQTFASGEKLSKKTESIGTLSIRFPKEKKRLSGGYYTIIQLLTWENIIVQDIASVSDELILMLDENDVDRAFSLVQNVLNKQ